MAAMVTGELNKSIDNGDTKKEGIQHIKARLGESVKMGKQCNAWPLYWKYG